MSATRIAAGLGLGVLLLAGCEAANPNPQHNLGVTPGTVEYQLRQQQLNAARQDPGRAQQNPVATGVGVDGIQRQATPGTGGSVNPVATGVGVGGIERAGSIGAPATR